MLSIRVMDPTKYALALMDADEKMATLCFCRDFLKVRWAFIILCNVVAYFYSGIVWNRNSVE